MNLQILFPESPDRNEVDLSFAAELNAAKSAGFEVGLVPWELTFGHFKSAKKGPALYRGWILEPSQYKTAYEKAKNSGIDLWTTPEEYRYGSELPLWYRDLGAETSHVILRWTPKSIWFPKDTFPQVFPDLPELLLSSFGDRSVIVKDYLKSQKHYWYEACFIPNLKDSEHVMKVTKTFLELQDQFLSGGLVFREFVEFKRVGIHPKSRMPLINEWRAFFWDSKLLYLAPYWSDGADYSSGVSVPNPVQAEELARNIKSRFFALDIAELQNGNWMAIEVNEGCTAGIPEGGNPHDFYQALAKIMGDQV